MVNNVGPQPFPPTGGQNNFLGEYVSLAALQAAHPTAQAGNYAHVNPGAGQPVQQYIWDTDDNSWTLGTAMTGVTSVNGDAGPAVTLDSDDISDNGAANKYVTASEKAAATSIASVPDGTIPVIQSGAATAAGLRRMPSGAIRSDNPIEVAGAGAITIDFKDLQAGGDISGGATGLLVRSLSTDLDGYMATSLYDGASGSTKMFYDVLGARFDAPSLSGKTELEDAEFLIVNNAPGAVFTYTVSRPNDATPISDCNFIIWLDGYNGQKTHYDYKKSHGGQGFTLGPGETTVSVESARIGFPANSDANAPDSEQTFLYSHVLDGNDNLIQLQGETVTFPPSPDPRARTAWLPFLGRNVALSVKRFLLDEEDAVDHPVTLRRDMPTQADAQSLVEASLNDNSGLWTVANNQIDTGGPYSGHSNRSDATIRAQIPGFLDVDGNEIPTTPVAANTIKLRAGTITRIFGANDYRVVNSPVFEGDINGGSPDAANVNVSNANLTGILNQSGNVQEALDRIDNTGIGAQPRQITGSFAATYFEGSQNTDTWYGGRQTVHIRVAPTSNGQYTFTMPDSGDMTSLFNDLASRGLGEVYTLTIEYAGGSTGFVNRNRLTISNASVSNGFPQGTFPTVLAQGQSATFRIERVGSTTGQWERLGIQQAVNPAPTFGEFVFQNTAWNNADSSFLPPASSVLKGYAFPVIGSNPNDGTLRQGLLDSGVSDRVIYDGDYVVWTADSFTSWTNGNDWFVLPRNQLELLTREQANFLAQITELDSRVDVAPVQMLTNDALSWISENPLAAAPFLTPSTDPNNPRSGDDYAYIGGRENRNAQQQFQFSQNRFNSYLTVGITPGFITGHPESDIYVRIYDVDRNLIDNFNLANDFTFRDDSDFTNSTVRHYTRSTSVNYPFLATIEVWLTRSAEHFRINPETVDVTQNIPDNSFPETKLDQSVREKLNRAIPPQGVTYESIEDRLSPYARVTTRTPATDARYYSDDGSGAYPSDLSDFSRVPANNPIFESTNIVLFVAAPEPGNFVLRNLTSSSEAALDQSTANVDVIESLTNSGITYFVYRVTSISIGDRFEVLRIDSQQVVAWQNSIDELSGDVERIDAELKHAALNLPDEVIQVLENDVSVTEESTPAIKPSEYNKQLGGASSTTQTVFYEPSPVSPGAGTKQSQPLSALSGDQVRRKLLYVPESQPANQQSYITAFDGATGRDLISYIEGEYLVNVRVPAQPSSTTTNTIYPAPATRISGPGIWHNVPALTFVNGVPVPEADELFFTRSIPASSTTLNIQYRGHANGNVFGTSSTTLAGVGGGSDVFTTFTLNDGSEQAFVEVRWYASRREIRVSVTERVSSGLPTINDIEVILSYDETITIPATPGTTRQVAIESIHNGFQVFAFKPASNGNLIVVGDQSEIDTNRTYETWFGAALGGHISIADQNAVFLNFEDFDPISATVTDLENHATLPQFGLFTTEYSRETDLNIGVTIKPSGLNVNDLPTSSTGLQSGDVWFNGTSLQFVP